MTILLAKCVVVRGVGDGCEEWGGGIIHTLIAGASQFQDLVSLCAFLYNSIACAMPWSLDTLDAHKPEAFEYQRLLLTQVFSSVQLNTGPTGIETLHQCLIIG